MNEALEIKTAELDALVIRYNWASDAIQAYTALVKHGVRCKCNGANVTVYPDTQAQAALVLGYQRVATAGAVPAKDAILG